MFRRGDLKSDQPISRTGVRSVVLVCSTGAILIKTRTDQGSWIKRGAVVIELWGTKSPSARSGPSRSQQTTLAKVGAVPGRNKNRDFAPSPGNDDGLSQFNVANNAAEMAAEFGHADTPQRGIDHLSPNP